VRYDCGRFHERIPIVDRNGRHEKPLKTRRKRDREGIARERKRGGGKEKERKKERDVYVYTRVEGTKLLYRKSECKCE